MVLQVPLDYALLLGAAVSAYYLRFSGWAISLKTVRFEMSIEEFLSIVAFVALGWIVIFALSGLYSTDVNRKFSRDLTRVVLACSTGLAGVALYILFTQQLFDSRFLVAAGWAFAIVYIIAGRVLMRGVKAVLYRAGIGLRRAAIVGNGGLGNEIAALFVRRPELGYSLVGSFPSFSETTARQLTALKLDELIFISPRAREDEAIAALAYCEEHHIVFKYSADLFATYSANNAVYPLGGVPMVEVRKTRLEGWGRVAKRVFDISLSVLIIAVASPIMLAIAVVILLETGSPVIYKNERVGLRGKNFFTLKFRSMYAQDSTGEQFGKAGLDAERREQELIEEHSVREGPIYKIKDDPRVTAFGRFLRRTSLDELPQFFNVLAGQMSVVGPRPHQPREVAQYRNKHPRVFALKPGITGLAQISGRSDLSFDTEIGLDILYIEKWNLLLDIIIFLKTPFVLFRKRKAL